MSEWNKQLEEAIIKAVTPYAFGEDGDLTALSDKDCYQWIDAIVETFTRLKDAEVERVLESLLPVGSWTEKDILANIGQIKRKSK